MISSTARVFRSVQYVSATVDLANLTNDITLGAAVSNIARTFVINAMLGAPITGAGNVFNPRWSIPDTTHVRLTHNGSASGTAPVACWVIEV
jgi:hypothetical protein